MGNNEKIICAAIHFDDGKEYFHQPKNTPTGITICGMRHHNCFATIALIVEAYGGTIEKGKKRAFPGFKETQGFLTSENRFVDRKEALSIALLENQVLDKTKLGDMLHSEDLY